METGTTQGQNAAAAAGSAASSAQGDGNDNLSEAFDKAITEARKTLELTTVKGADLYALKQSVR